MLSNSLKRLNRTNRLITVDDISDSVLAGRSAAHTACWKYLQVHSYDSALEHANTIVKREPDKPDGYVFKARALFQMKRFTEAEDVLLHVMKIAEQNVLIRGDVEGMIKLKDELANSRVEILRGHKFRDPIDIAEMHWNDCKQSILELIGFGSLARGSRPVDRETPPEEDKRSQKTTPMDVDIEIIDIIGPERAKQLYPELEFEAPVYKSTPNSTNGFSNFSSYSRRRAASHSNIDNSEEFSVRDKDLSLSTALDTSATPSSRTTSLATKSKDNTHDVELRTAGLKTALMLAEEKSDKYERKCRQLEEELKKVYQNLIKINDEKKGLQKKCNTLEEQLDRVMASPPKRSAPVPEVQIIKQTPPQKKSPKQRPMMFTNSNRSNDRFQGNRPYNRGGAQFTASMGTGLRPNNPFPERNVGPYAGRFPPGILPAPPHYGMVDNYRNHEFQYRHDF